RDNAGASHAAHEPDPSQTPRLNLISSVASDPPDALFLPRRVTQLQKRFQHDRDVVRDRADVGNQLVSDGIDADDPVTGTEESLQAIDVAWAARGSHVLVWDSDGAIPSHDFPTCRWVSPKSAVLKSSRAGASSGIVVQLACPDG